mmetsp:Transcript_16687/g.25726  ORF Transcript_16687/g.25726 Transcript_16687/m.25726 type:complete len:170 (+) Transcript_16687:1946-2455(+)
MSWLRLKKVSHLFNQGSEFFFICNDDYDHEIDIISSSYQDFKISIPKRIEPQCLAIFDAVQADINSEGFGTRMVIASARDSDFYYDVINPQINLNKIKEVSASPIKGAAKAKLNKSRTDVAKKSSYESTTPAEINQQDSSGLDTYRVDKPEKKKKTKGPSALLFSMVYT